MLAACGRPSRTTGSQAPATGTSKRRIRYGEADDAQFADLRMPEDDPLATVVLLHGGYWLPQYGLDLMDPLATTLTGLGYATWNVEYRRTSAGGGFPNTLTDVAAAVDRLAGPGLPTGLSDTVVLLGHSAGGHLAAWAASRRSTTPGGAAKVPLTGMISLSGVLELTEAASDPPSSEPVIAFMGGTPTQAPARYPLADPSRLVPASCPVWAVHAEDDVVVSASQSSGYVQRARAAGGRAELVSVPGDHFTLIDPSSQAFPTVKRLVGDAR
jgi:acetyl esterase/lipase